MENDLVLSSRLGALLFALICLPSLAHAAGVVATCDEASLNAALTGGGSVTFSCSGTITVTATKTISADTTLDGSGQSVTISGGSAVRIFVVNSGVNFGLQLLTLTAGLAQGSGGAVLNNGTMTVNNSTFSGNQAVGSTGVNGLNCSTTNCTAGSGTDGGSVFGGAIADVGAGSLSITNSTLNDNVAQGGNGGGGGSSVSTCFLCIGGHGGNGGNGGTAYGGAISQAVGNSGTLNITSCTAYSNHVTGGAGGNGGRSSGPIGTGPGGNGGNGGNAVGFFLYYVTQGIEIFNATIAGNVPDQAGSGGAAGTGIPNGTAGASGTATATLDTATDFINPLLDGTAVLVNVILNGTPGAECPPVDVNYKISSASQRNITDGIVASPGGNCPAGEFIASNFPQLGQAGNNGGPTMTIPLLAGSPAIDFGLFGCPPRDQRGYVRIDGKCDIGAYEYGGLPDYPISATGGRDIRFRLGQPFSFVVASFTDSDPNPVITSFSATINWGDSSPSDSNTRIVSNVTGGFNVVGSHAYQKVGRYIITVNITDSGGANATATAVSTARMWPRAYSH